MIVVLLACGCSKPGRDAFAEAEALEAQGKVEEAARLFDLTCCYAPEGEKCSTSDQRAAEARIKGAEKAMDAGQFLAASGLLISALATADGASAQKAGERLGSPELKQGVAYERALTLGKTDEARKAIEAVAATTTPAGALAKAWLDKERPPMVVKAVKAACGPDHQGSCTRATAELRKAALTGPESEEATALAEEEERRVYPLRLNAEAFLQNFAAAAKRDSLFEACKLPGDVQGAGANIPGTTRNLCQSFCGCTSYIASPEDVDEQIKKRQINDVIWRRTMRSIGDSDLVAALEERKKAAQEVAEIAKVEIPKPRPAPKTVSGKK